MADALPGLGIVAAVLGVVVTMGALGGPPEEIGHKVAAALVGTFLGILLCYGLVGPLAASMAKNADEEHAYYLVLRIASPRSSKALLRFWPSNSARRAIPGHVRPKFQELEKTCRNKALRGCAWRTCCRRHAAARTRRLHAAMAETRPIIIKKKKAGHEGHHGGAWKVAYADFVTAMMALFIVLWLMNTSKPVKDAVSGYFRDPSGTANKVGSAQAGSGENFALYQRQHGSAQRRAPESGSGGREVPKN